MSSERRRVNFRDSPPSGSSSSHHASDSGVGSLSDQASSRASKPDRSSTGHDVQSQWTDLAALQEAYRAVYESKERWKDKARRLDEDASQARKDKKEIEAKWRGVITRNDELEEEKAKVFHEKKALADDVGKLQDENAALREQLAEAHALIEKLRRNSPPVMSGANPASSSKHPHRSASKREKARDSDRDQKERLEKRFEPGRDADIKSDGTSSSRATRSSRRGSYIEPFGPAASPAAARAHYATYSESTHQQPTFTRTQEPTFSTVPRTLRGHVDVDTIHPAYGVDDAAPYKEDGSYYPYPIPAEREQIRHHRSRGSRS